MVLIPSLLASETLLNSSLYIALALTVPMIVWIGLVMPYDNRVNNLRLLSHRALLSMMLILLIVSKSTITPDTDPDSPLLYLGWIILCILVLDLLTNLPFVIRELVGMFKREGMVDIKLLMERKG